MQAAVTEALPGGMPMPADMIANNQGDQRKNQIAEDNLVGEMLIGFDKLRGMPHTELRGVIGSRIATSYADAKTVAMRWTRQEPRHAFSIFDVSGRSVFTATSITAARWPPSPAPCLLSRLWSDTRHDKEITSSQSGLLSFYAAFLCASRCVTISSALSTSAYL